MIPPILRELYLDMNWLKGTIPAVGDGNLQALRVILLSHNDLEGSVPWSLCRLRAGGFGYTKSLQVVCGHDSQDV